MTQAAFSLEASRSLCLAPGCVVELHEGFLAGDHPGLAHELSEALPWVQELYLRGGRYVPAPRLTSFHGDPGVSYSYSGVRYTALAFTSALETLRERLHRELGYRFNCALVNLYRDGSDSVGYHADDEPELGPSRHDIAVASLSLGATRRFVLRRRKGAERHELTLPGGSLLVMRGRTQHEYVHSLPKTRRPVGPRVNLTYRVIALSPGSGSAGSSSARAASS